MPSTWRLYDWEKPRADVGVSERGGGGVPGSTRSLSVAPSRRFYKPVAIRTPFIASFCAITLVIFVLLEIAASSYQSSMNASYQSSMNASYNSASVSSYTLFTSFTPASYFLGAYLPTMVGVLYSMLWDISYIPLMQMEPFFQLAAPGGAEATDSLLLDYASVSLPAVLFKSIKKAHGTIFGLLFTTGTCSSTGDGGDCQPSLALRTALARVEQALMGAIFFIVAYLAIRYRRRQSGIYAEATSIAGLATLLHDPILLDDLRRIPPQASASEIEKLFKARRYGLGYSSQHGVSSEYGLITLGSAPTGPSPKETPRYLPIPSDDETNAANQTPLRPSRRKASRAPSLYATTLIAFWLALASLLTLILYYRLSGPAHTGLPARTGFETFMDSQSIGVRFLMTTLGVIIKHIWTLIEKRTRTLEPFCRLSHGPASPNDIILVPSAAVPITAILPFLRRGHFFVAAIATVVVLTGLLTVALAGVPFDSASSYTAYTVSTYLSTAILALILVALAAVVVRGRGDPVLPRKPESLAAVALVLCGAQMGGDWRG